jgi:hypothetical protein
MRIRTFNLEQQTPIQKYGDGRIANYGMTHLINLMGPDVIYVETGVCGGSSISYIVQRCTNIKKAYGVDFYLPNVDTFEQGGYFVYNEEKVKRLYNRAKKRIIASGQKDKVTLILEHTDVAVDYFDDNSIDFLFLDHYLNAKDVAEACEKWYNKVKIGAYFAGHDWGYTGVHQEVLKFRENHNITSPLSVFGAEWVWKKEGNI